MSVRKIMLGGLLCATLSGCQFPYVEYWPDVEGLELTRTGCSGTYVANATFQNVVMTLNVQSFFTPNVQYPSLQFSIALPAGASAEFLSGNVTVALVPRGARTSAQTAHHDVATIPIEKIMQLVYTSAATQDEHYNAPPKNSRSPFARVPLPARNSGQLPAMVGADDSLLGRKLPRRYYLEVRLEELARSDMRVTMPRMKINGADYALPPIFFRREARLGGLHPWGCETVMPVGSVVPAMPAVVSRH